MYLGILPISNAHVTGTMFGTVKAHFIRRMSEDECWNPGALKQLKGTPWRPVLGSGDSMTPTHNKSDQRAELEDHHADAVPPAIEDEELHERMRPTRHTYEHSGRLAQTYPSTA